MLEWFRRGARSDDGDPDKRPQRRPRRWGGQYNFTERTRQVFALARQEAIELGHDYVGTEHLLLGLIGEGQGVAVEVLRRSGIESAPLVDRINESIRKGGGAILLGELPYTSRAKKSIEYAMSAAKELDHAYVGTEHLLLGLLREEKGIAAQVLNSFGLTLRDATRLTCDVLDAEPPSATAVDFRFRVDDDSDRSISEQIIQQVQEGVAIGALHPGDELPAVGLVADELGIAPGTVERAYSELQLRGVVITEAVRGTHIADHSKKPRKDSGHGDTLTGLLRSGVLAAFHLGASATEVREAFERALQEIFDDTHPESL